RHTRFSRDWSSDVCSSDLVWIIGNTAANLAAQNKTTGFDFLWKTAGFDISFTLLPWSRSSYYWEAFLVGLLNTLLVAFIGIVFRSEERRVGKEGRSLGAAD